MKGILGTLNQRKLIKNYYLHLPFCLKKCYYCAFPVMALGTRPDEQFMRNQMYDKYISQLLQEMHIFFDHSNHRPSNWAPLETIYFGGGTPSLFDPQHINKILRSFNIQSQEIMPEITLQMNPSQIKKLRLFEQQCKINRFSVGIQTTNQKTLFQFNRDDKQFNKKLVQKQLYEYSVVRDGNLNLDFIIDFNSQKEDEQEMFQLIRSIKPKHLTMYSLEINPGSYMHTNLKKYPKKYSDQKALHEIQYQNYLKICQKLTQMGFHNYEISNFCVEDLFKSKHNLAYWEGDRQFGAFGMGATSLINSMRVSRPKNLSKYYKYIQLLCKGTEKEASQLLQINDEHQYKQKIKWVILSQIRRNQRLQIERILNKYMQNKQDVKDILNEIYINLLEINKYRGEEIIILQRKPQLTINLKFPEGLILSDQIGYEILGIVDKYSQ